MELAKHHTVEPKWAVLEAPGSVTASRRLVVERTVDHETTPDAGVDEDALLPLIQIAVFGDQTDAGRLTPSAFEVCVTGAVLEDVIQSRLVVFDA